MAMKHGRFWSVSDVRSSGAHLGAGRLLYGMGRDRVLPRSLFAAVNARTGSPDRNVIFIGAMAFAGAVAVRYELAAEVLNFGAFLAFMGVNLAAMRTAVRQPAAAASC